MTIRQIPKKFGIATIIMTLLLATSTIIGQTPPANALSHSMNVAYVTDFGSGLCDTSGPGSGSSIFVNAIISGGGTPTGCPGGGPHTYTTGSNGFGTVATGNTVTLTDVSVSSIDSGGVGALAPYDTVLLYEVCDIGSHPGLVTALNSYLTTGGDHKVIILDGDRCSPISAGSADYSTFLFPFTSSNPGPLGASGTITFVESEPSPAVLTRAIPTGAITSTDAVGDSNTFTSNAGGWCTATEGTNGVSVTGIQTGYARTATGGLAIWNGWDNWFTFGPNALDAQLLDNILDQPFNPDNLPCGIPVTGIKLNPLTATNPAGSTHTVTATVVNVNNGNPVPGVTVNFSVTSGPNSGVTGSAVTDGSGNASFTYVDSGGAGTDTIVATFTDTTGGSHTSNSVTKTWVARSTTTVTTASQTGNILPTTAVTDSATVTGSGSSPPDLTGSVSFQLCGPNPSPSTTSNCAAAGTVAITTPNGGAFTATSPSQSPTQGGSYCFTATYTPASGSQYTTSNSTTTTNECFSVLASTTVGSMTGGGTIANVGNPPSTSTHGFELQCDVSKTPNNLEVNWSKGNKFHLTSLTSAFCVMDPSITPNPPAAGFNTYVGTGTGTFNGVAGATASWTFTDAGEPGTNDHATIIIKDGSSNTVLSVSGNLQHGNQQAH